jgi:hypothetical protein
MKRKAIRCEPQTERLLFVRYVAIDEFIRLKKGGSQTTRLLDTYILLILNAFFDTPARRNRYGEGVERRACRCSGAV